MTDASDIHEFDLPRHPVYAFTPAYDMPDKTQQIRIVFQDMQGYVPTALAAVNLDEAEDLCDRLNARLGLDREAWTALVAASLSTRNDRKAMH